ncbi:hypothetical protein PALU110988_19755 [Paenibacillus lupini]|uniref:hypothetical protein n=1 Tax=Paenibacillus lupini TaxID=1450204 RepID=UPI00141EC771|nr:hypothetical protein [Paenibacillus lupini]NIK22969.1 PBP1b-binding outer membrane lipoprotein LpoB [Paenibacillus lupini]
MNKIYMIVVVLVIFLSGCTSQQNSNPAVDDQRAESHEFRKVTAAQLGQITKDMTYKEVINTLGQSKDIGSGRYIIKYELENGDFLDFNFGSYEEVLNDQSYAAIQKLLN